MSGKIDLNVSATTVMPGGDYGRVSISGSGKIQGSLHADSIDCSGAAKVLGDVVTGYLNVSEAVSVGAGIEAEEVYSDDVLNVVGLLNAETIELHWGHGSGDIGCAQLSVHKTKSRGVLRLSGRPTGYALEVNSIEADAADLEYATAEVVRTRDVRIGEGCRVRCVEYTGSCQAEEGAVQELVQINGGAPEDGTQE